ncbi:MAG: DegV family protein [Christensenellales bacterium]
MKIAISVDSAADLSKELIEKYNIAVVPFTVNLGDDSRLDGINVNGAELLDFVDEKDELPKTSAPSEVAYQEHFENLLNSYDYVIHFCISAELSVACSNAIRASKVFDGKVTVIDARSLSSGIALPALYACDLISEGKEYEEIVRMCKEVVPFVQASFTLDSLKLLHKGGRCSGTTRLISMALAIKPSMLMKDGVLQANKKYMMKKFEVVVKKYVLDTLQDFNDYDTKRVFVTHTPISAEIVDMVKDLVKDKFEEVLECDAGATVSSHCGKNTIGILYINKKRDK